MIKLIVILLAEICFLLEKVVSNTPVIMICGTLFVFEYALKRLEITDTSWWELALIIGFPGYLAYIGQILVKLMEPKKPCSTEN